MGGFGVVRGMESCETDLARSRGERRGKGCGNGRTCAADTDREGGAVAARGGRSGMRALMAATSPSVKDESGAAD